ncbi:MAG: gamma-glutamyl-gamma-aminobutyrate hydrolase family protein [Anaerolineales bacterium]
MPAPLIGVTTLLSSSPKTYPTALIKAGAIPVLIPTNLPPENYPDLLKRLDGIIFSGGGDIDLQYFPGEPHPKIYGVDLERDAFELSLARLAVDRDLPLMGICRGFQVINVALGGTLYTHILDQLPNALEHSCYPANPPDFLAHDVNLRPGTKLAAIFQAETIKVNSLHHQGTKQLAPGLIPAATAPDGLLEAFEIPDHPFGLAVQWHPEWMPDDENMQRLFRTFVSAAAPITIGITQ